jgi:transcriptional regulator with XRE-family HTH domain
MTNDQNHTKTQGTRFHEYLQEREITEEQFHAMMKKMGLSRNTAQSFISKEMNDMRAPNICLLQNLFGVPPSLFGLEDDFFTSEHSYNEGELYCFNYKKEESDTYRPFVENFFRAVNQYLLSAQKRLCVSDYFVKNQGLVTKEHLSFYREKSKEYFKKLEEKISQNPKFEYKRIVQLPLNFDLASDPARFVVEDILRAASSNSRISAVFMSSPDRFACTPIIWLTIMLR